MKTYTLEEKRRVQADLGSDQLPSDAFMAMLEEENAAEAAGQRLTSGYPKGGVAGDLEEAVHRATVNALLLRAMDDREMSKAGLARALGVSRQRVGEILASRNLELETVVRMADQIGCDVKLALVPRDAPEQVVEAFLPHAETDRSDAEAGVLV